MSSARRDDSCGADVLELYLRFRAKQDNATKETWIELLDVTIPKLKCRRDLLKIRKATRLAYVMALVGSMRDPVHASQAVAAMLVGHWCDESPCAFVQKDAIRHSAVAIFLPKAPPTMPKRIIAKKLETGVRNAVDGVGLESLCVVKRWNPEEGILFKGGAEVILDELDEVAHDCRTAASDAEAREVLKEYLDRKRMSTFVTDFIAWGRAQLNNLPPSIFDRACCKLATPVRGNGSSTPNSKNAAGGGSSAGGGGSGSARGANGSSSKSSKAANKRKRCDGSPTASISTDAAAAASGKTAKSIVDEAPLADVGRGASSSATKNKRGGGSGHGSRRGSRSGTAADRLTLTEHEDEVAVGEGEVNYISDDVMSADDDYEPRDDDDDGDDAADPDYEIALPPAGLEREGDKEADSRVMNRGRRKPMNVEGKKRDAMAAREAALTEKFRQAPRRTRRQQRELSRSAHVIFAARKDRGVPTKWDKGVVIDNRKDGTYDVFLRSGNVARVVRRADLFPCRGALEPPPGCPIEVFNARRVMAPRALRGRRRRRALARIPPAPGHIARRKKVVETDSEGSEYSEEGEYGEEGEEEESSTSGDSDEDEEEEARSDSSSDSDEEKGEEELSEEEESGEEEEDEEEQHIPVARASRTVQKAIEKATQRPGKVMTRSGGAGRGSSATGTPAAARRRGRFSAGNTGKGKGPARSSGRARSIAAETAARSLPARAARKSMNGRSYAPLPEPPVPPPSLSPRRSDRARRSPGGRSSGDNRRGADGGGKHDVPSDSEIAARMEVDSGAGAGVGGGGGGSDTSSDEGYNVFSARGRRRKKRGK